MVFIQFRVFLILTITSTQNGFIFENITYNTSIARTTVRIIDDFYKQISTTLSISNAAKTTTLRQQSGMINEVLFSSRSKMVVRIEDDRALQNNVLRIFNLIFVDSYESFR